MPGVKTAEAAGGLAETWAHARCSSPCPWSERWCRPCPSRRQSQRSPEDTSPRIWRPGTWLWRQPAAAASWAPACPVETGNAVEICDFEPVNAAKRQTAWWTMQTCRKRSMSPTVMYIVSCSRRNFRLTCTSQSTRMARMLPVTSCPCKKLGLTFCSVWRERERRKVLNGVKGVSACKVWQLVRQGLPPLVWGMYRSPWHIHCRAWGCRSPPSPHPWWQCPGWRWRRPHRDLPAHSQRSPWEWGRPAPVQPGELR